MPCIEWWILVERYRSAAKTYHEAVDDLGTVPGADFNLAWQQSEKSRENCDAARTALLSHEHDHGCLGHRQPASNHQALDLTEELILGDQGQSGG
jgi:hypothetical protein